MEDAAGAIADLPNQADTLFELSNSKEFLFSDRVILVEGRTETTILPHLYQKIRGRSLLEDRVGIIRLNGSGSLKKAYDVLIAMGLDARIVADLDYIFKIAFNNGILGVTDERSAEIRSIFQRLADDGQLELSNDGLPKNSNLCTASEGFELLAADAEAIPIIATLVEDLKQQHIWIWTKGAIEAHIGIEKNFTAQRQFVESLAAGNALDGIPDLGAVHAAMNFVFAET
jgi:putative ATP-dependent endonuclease of OLD family